MKKRLLMLAVPLFVCAAMPAYVRTPVSDKVYPGISVAVGNVKAGVIAAEAYGLADVASGRAMSTDTPLRMASVSKSITATAIMMLVQAHKIALDTPVAAYVPRFTSNGSRITLRQLLNHTSGIPGHNHGDPILHGDGAYSQAEFFKRLNTTKLYAKPGTHWDYANENYYLLAEVVQNVTGEHFAAWLHRHIFVPAKMTHTYSDEGQTNAQIALGYVHRTTKDPFLQCPAPDWSGELGAGGIISTPSDLVRFDIALFNGTLLNVAFRKAMMAPSFKLSPYASYALGWFALTSGVVQHEGDFTVASSTNVIFPDGTFVAEAANGTNLGPDFSRLYFATKLQNQYGTHPVKLGSRKAADLAAHFKPFTTCEEIDEQLFGAPH